MPEAHHRLGRVSRLRADAVGQPGQRRFRLMAESRSGGTALLWLEKEQLFNLGLALKRLIALVGDKGASPAQAETDAKEPVAEAGEEMEFQAGQLAVGYDANTALYVIAAHRREQAEQEPPTLDLLATEQEVDALADEAFAVCAAGRPPCPLCGGPLGPERHICARHNGHGKLER